jgi:hypothetical protein
VLLVAAAVILGGVVVAALGRAGEMTTFAGDTAPIELDEVSATDVALLRPPMSLWGYNAQATEDALRVIAGSMTARDVEIATLRRELADLQRRQDGVRATGPGGRTEVPASPGAQAVPAGPRAPVVPGSPAGPGAPVVPGSPAGPGASVVPGTPAGPGAPVVSGSPAGPAGVAVPAGPPAGQPRPADPSGPGADEEHRADPPWLPAWQRPSGRGTDE